MRWGRGLCWGRSQGQAVGGAEVAACSCNASWSSWRNWSRSDDLWTAAPAPQKHQTPLPPCAGNPNSGLRKNTHQKNRNIKIWMTQSPFSYLSCSVHDSLTVALVQAEAAVAEDELSCPVRLRQARVYPGAVVPAAVRFGVDFQTGLDKVQLRLIQLLHLVLLSRGCREKYIRSFAHISWGVGIFNDYIFIIFFWLFIFILFWYC